MQPRIRTERPAPRSSRELVLTALRARGPMSRAELARYAGVAPSTISGVVQDLMAAGLVVGSRSTPSHAQPDRAQPGRPGLRLTLNPRLGAVAGVEFCFDRLRVLLCDLAHNVIGTADCELPTAHASEAALAVARKLVDQALAEAGLEPRTRSSAPASRCPARSAATRTPSSRRRYSPAGMA